MPPPAATNDRQTAMAERQANALQHRRPRITIFGGTGFLGQRIVRHLLRRGFPVRVAVRRAQRVHEIFGTAGGAVESMDVDVHDERRIDSALAGAGGVVNAVSLYRERGRHTFASVHVDAAERIALLAREQGIGRLVHISGIGADPDSASAYIRARGIGEIVVSETLASATVLRPAVMFAPDDAFLTTIVGLLKILPAYPLFGRGRTRLQPVHVENIGEAVAAMLEDPASAGRTYDVGGPEVFTYAALVRAVAAEIGRRPLLLPLSYRLWFGLARASALLPNPPLSRSQIELVQIDTVAASGMPTLEAFDIAPLGIRETVREIVRHVPRAGGLKRA
ncbi:complex I NDUFA9 subunit family protein [Vineibacter terrae]|uniref:complex I NDUFA9 subunit family protein n=1 Tax=Vineibacter terrae TaxID=2586908 RepID=UPI002E36F2A2|nr:complex I NDUFA9 subunit family protein [Vineibacter terrae]HEX2885953.1 complex I NDUFA9 subunit family protein [Vineibacter terrae]